MGRCFDLSSVGAGFSSTNNQRIGSDMGNQTIAFTTKLFGVLQKFKKKRKSGRLPSKFDCVTDSKGDPVDPKEEQRASTVLTLM